MKCNVPNAVISEIICRDLRAAEDIQITMREYVRTVHASSFEGSATEQRSMRKHSKSQQKLLYAKDVTCPSDWRTFLMETVLPPYLSYMKCNDLSKFILPAMAITPYATFRQGTI
jgi:hypothetical protein